MLSGPLQSLSLSLDRKRRACAQRSCERKDVLQSPARPRRLAANAAQITIVIESVVYAPVAMTVSKTSLKNAKPQDLP